MSKKKTVRVETTDARGRQFHDVSAAAAKKLLSERENANNFTYVDGKYVRSSEITEEQLENAGAVKSSPALNGG